MDSLSAIPQKNKNQEAIDRLQRQIDSLKAITSDSLNGTSNK